MIEIIIILYVLVLLIYIPTYFKRSQAIKNKLDQIKQESNSMNEIPAEVILID